MKILNSPSRLFIATNSWNMNAIKCESPTSSDPPLIRLKMEEETNGETRQQPISRIENIKKEDDNDDDDQQQPEQQEENFPSKNNQSNTCNCGDDNDNGSNFHHNKQECTLNRLSQNSNKMVGGTASSYNGSYDGNDDDDKLIVQDSTCLSSSPPRLFTQKTEKNEKKSPSRYCSVCEEETKDLTTFHKRQHLQKDMKDYRLFLEDVAKQRKKDNHHLDDHAMVVPGYGNGNGNGNGSGNGNVNGNGNGNGNGN